MASSKSSENLIINEGPIEHSSIENTINMATKEVIASPSTNKVLGEVKKSGEISK